MRMSALKQEKKTGASGVLQCCNWDPEPVGRVTPCAPPPGVAENGAQVTDAPYLQVYTFVPPELSPPVEAEILMLDKTVSRELA